MARVQKDAENMAADYQKDQEMLEVALKCAAVTATCLVLAVVAVVASPVAGAAGLIGAISLLI